MRSFFEIMLLFYWNINLSGTVSYIVSDPTSTSCELNSYTSLHAPRLFDNPPSNDCPQNILSQHTSRSIYPLPHSVR
uniref:Putative secreted peptide n=1 Tax=Anopheles braziliensis TaxID=58242 RepID=A0A2M3ZXI7_9DIPT